MVFETKNNFLDSLSDEQLGFFHAHEYSRQLETLLQDKVTYKQFLLFKEWKEEEEAQSELSSYESDAINALSSRMEILFEGMNKKMEQLERKIEAVTNNRDQDIIQSLTAKIEKLERQQEAENLPDIQDVLTQQADSMRAFASKINERMENVQKNSEDVAKKVSALEASLNTIQETRNTNLQSISNLDNGRMDRLEQAIQDLECAKTKLKIPKSVIGQLLQDNEFKRFTLPSNTKLYIEDISSDANAFFAAFTLCNKEKSLLDRTITEIISFLQNKNYLNVRRTLSPVIEKMINKWSLEERAVFQRITDTYFDSSACSIYSWNDDLLSLAEEKLKILLNTKSKPSDLLNKHT